MGQYAFGMSLAISLYHHLSPPISHHHRLHITRPLSVMPSSPLMAGGSSLWERMRLISGTQHRAACSPSCKGTKRVPPMLFFRPIAASSSPLVLTEQHECGMRRVETASDLGAPGCCSERLLLP